MITIVQYAGPWIKHPDFTPARRANAERLLVACAKLETFMIADGIVFHDNPVTGSNISGSKYGGFRPQSCPIGAANSNHKEGLAGDRFDPLNEIDAWCMLHLDVLAECGIWIEHPDKTNTWSHWQCVPPHSGRRVFYP